MDRDRDRAEERDTAETAPRSDRSFIVEEDTDDRVVVERNRDASGDMLAPSDQDVVVREDTVDTMPSRALNDPRELTPAEQQRLATDTTSAPRDAVAPSGPMDAPTAATAVGTPGAETMAGRRLGTPATAADTEDREGQIFARIREGMKVIDAAGEELGKVDMIRAGDPQAITTAGQETRGDAGLIGDFAEALAPYAGEPDVPEPFRSRLIREGFIKIDGKGWIDTDRYLTADMIASVEGDEVRLAVTRDNIPSERG